MHPDEDFYPGEPENPNEGNFFRRIGNGVKRAKETLAEKTNRLQVAAQGDIQAQILQMVLPHVKRMIPGIEHKLKCYLSGVSSDETPGDGIEKAILMKLRKDGKTEIIIFDAKGIEIVPTAAYEENPENIILNKLELDEYVSKFLSGTFDAAATDTN